MDTPFRLLLELVSARKKKLPLRGLHGPGGVNFFLSKKQKNTNGPFWGPGPFPGRERRLVQLKRGYLACAFGLWLTTGNNSH